MSFGTHARKVRNPELSYARRVQALGSCVQLYRPIGFEATWRYLGQQVPGNWRRDAGVLVGYLGVIEASRRIRIACDAEYAAFRNREKARGNRTTGLDWSVQRLREMVWHGDEAAGARTALQHWRDERLSGARHRDADVVRLVALVGTALTTSVPAPNHRASLNEVVAELRRRERTAEEFEGSFRTAELRVVAWHLEVALDGAQALNRS